jgi:hypothetical protein
MSEESWHAEVLAELRAIRELIEAAVRVPRTEWRPEYPNSAAQQEWQARQSLVDWWR